MVPPGSTPLALSPYALLAALVTVNAVSGPDRPRVTSLSFENYPRPMTSPTSYYRARSGYRWLSPATSMSSASSAARASAEMRSRGRGKNQNVYTDPGTTAVRRSNTLDGRPAHAAAVYYPPSLSQRRMVSMQSRDKKKPMHRQSHVKGPIMHVTSPHHISATQFRGSSQRGMEGRRDLRIPAPLA